MTDQNDWQPQDAGSNPAGGQPEGGGAARTYQTGQAAAAETSPTDFLTEGWGTAEALAFDEITARFKLVFSRAKGPILYAWFAIALIPILLTVLMIALKMLGFITTKATLVVAPLIWLLNMGGWVLGVLLIALQFSLFKPLYQRVFVDPHSSMSMMDAIKSGGSVFLAMLLTLLALGLGVSITTTCCIIIPGLIVGFFFCQAPYQTGALGRDFGTAFKESARLNKAYWQSVLILFGLGLVAVSVMVVVGIVLTMGFGFVGALLGRAGAEAGMGVGRIATMVVGEALVFGLFLAQMAIFSTIETKETGRQPAA